MDGPCLFLLLEEILRIVHRFDQHPAILLDCHHIPVCKDAHCPARRLRRDAVLTSDGRTGIDLLTFLINAIDNLVGNIRRNLLILWDSVICPFLTHAVSSSFLFWLFVSSSRITEQSSGDVI